MRSATLAAVSALLLVMLAGCVPPPEGGAAHPNPIIIREFTFTPRVVTLDPSFGFSLYRGEPGVPRHQRAAGLGRAVAFNLADAMAEQLTALGYDVVRSDSAAVEPGARAIIVGGSFSRINEGRRRRVGAENSSVAVDAQIDYQAAGAGVQLLAAFQLDSRQVPGGSSRRQGADVKAAAARVGAAIAGYVADTARLNNWPGVRR